jgi:hypothetical protein
MRLGRFNEDVCQGKTGRISCVFPAIGRFVRSRGDQQFDADIGVTRQVAAVLQQTPIAQLVGPEQVSVH